LNQGPVDDGSGAAWDPGAPGSYDQAAWDAGTPPPPLDPAAAVDPDGPAFDAAGRDEGQAGSWDAGVASGPEPAVRSYDLGPAAFDAAPLPPPEPGPGDYDQARWDAAGGEVPLDPAAGPPPEGEPVEAELVDAELVEPEPLPEAPAPGPDLFTPGPLTPDFTGAQPLDAGRFGEGEPGAGGWPEEEVAAAEPEEVATAEPEEVAAGSGFEPAEAGGPGAVEAGTPPDAIEIGAGAEAEGAAAEEVPLASPSEFLSSLGPAARPAEPPASPAEAPDLGEEVIEDPSSVEVDVEEVAVAPPVPARPATALDVGGPSPTFVVGEHRVVVHTLEGQVLRGTIADVDLDATAIPLVAAPGNAPEPVAAARVKAIFFMLLPGGRPPAPEGSRVRVTFRDGRQVAGFSPDYDPQAVGFFMIPADSRTNTGRIWVYRAAVRQVSVS
ncbi:MAG TPA: hypothetical protein VIV59_07890, partial [Anaeromyxobacteraceae bacterium]